MSPPVTEFVHPGHRGPSADPIIVKEGKYPELSSYQYASNTPIMAVDLDGLESTNAKPPGQNANGSYSPAIDRTSNIVVEEKHVGPRIPQDRLKAAGMPGYSEWGDRLINWTASLPEKGDKMIHRLQDKHPIQTAGMTGTSSNPSGTNMNSTQAKNHLGYYDAESILLLSGAAGRAGNIGPRQDPVRVSGGVERTTKIIQNGAGQPLNYVEIYNGVKPETKEPIIELDTSGPYKETKVKSNGSIGYEIYNVVTEKNPGSPVDTIYEQVIKAKYNYIYIFICTHYVVQ